MTAPREVDEIETPPALEALAGLVPTHYRESLTLTTAQFESAPTTAQFESAPTTAQFESAPSSPPGPPSAEQWARLLLEQAPLTARAQMIATWTLLGIRLAPPWSDTQVLGWRVLHRAPDAIVLGARAAVGLTARVVFHTDGTRLTQAMFVRFDRPLGRRIWTRLAPGHRRFLKSLLSRAG